jgi:nitrile hydratase subunit beta
MHGFGPAVWSGSEAPYHEEWEARVFGLWAVSAAEGLGAGSGRVLREEMTPEHYLRATYYERWQWSNEQRLLRKARRVRTWLAQAATLEQATDTRFGPGERVRVRRMRPAGHTRCPRYVRGAEGIVERVRGADTLPDVGPYQGPVEPVYSIAFRSEHLFGANEGGTWTIMLDLYESYLEPV